MKRSFTSIYKRFNDDIALAWVFMATCYPFLHLFLLTISFLINRKTYTSVTWIVKSMYEKQYFCKTFNKHWKGSNILSSFRIESHTCWGRYGYELLLTNNIPRCGVLYCIEDRLRLLHPWIFVFTEYKWINYTYLFIYLYTYHTRNMKTHIREHTLAWWWGVNWGWWDDEIRRYFEMARCKYTIKTTKYTSSYMSRVVFFSSF